MSRCGSSRAAHTCPTRATTGNCARRRGRADIGIRLGVVRTDAEAGELRFPGSPTILIDGCDVFLDGHAVVGLSCRLYRSAEGASGSPSVEQLTAALARADRG